MERIGREDEEPSSLRGTLPLRELLQRIQRIIAVVDEVNAITIRRSRQTEKSAGAPDTHLDAVPGGDVSSGEVADDRDHSGLERGQLGIVALIERQVGDLLFVHEVGNIGVRCLHQRGLLQPP